MKKFMLNNLGNDWIYEGETEEEAIQEYLDQVLHKGATLKEWEIYCDEIGEKDSQLNMKEVFDD